MLVGRPVEPKARLRPGAVGVVRPKLKDLVSVGPATRRDLALLGIHTVAELACHEPEALYGELCRKTRKHQDICVLDTFRAAVEQARNPNLPIEQRVWWHWSRLRKASPKGK